MQGRVKNSEMDEIRNTFGYLRNVIKSLDSTGDAKLSNIDNAIINMISAEKKSLDKVYEKIMSKQAFKV